MSYPAVLYDHVPVRNESEASSTNDEDPNKIESGIAKSVSSMFRRASAPRERKAISNPREKTSDNGHEVADSKGFDASENRVVNANDDTNDTDTATGNGRIEEPDEFVTENIDDGDCPLQTIIEDIDQYYVLVPIPPPVSESSTTRQSLVTKTLESVEWSRRCLETIVSANTKGWNALRASVSEFVESYARDRSGLASIISQYDCEAVVDDSGNRLILSGSCTDLQEGDSPEDCQGAALIVPGIHNEGSALLSPPSSSSSKLRSTTIMVSAHDLLAMQRKRSQQRADRYASDATLVEEHHQDTFLACVDRNDGHFGPEPSGLTAIATQHGIQRWKRAFWKLTERKARALSCSARLLVHRYIRETGRRLIQTQCLLNDYRKSMDRYKRRGRILLSHPYAADVDREHNTAHLITVSENEDAEDPWTLVVVPQGTLRADGTGDSEGGYPAVEMTRLWHAWNRTRVSRRSAQTDSDS